MINNYSSMEFYIIILNYKYHYFSKLLQFKKMRIISHESGH